MKDRQYLKITYKSYEGYTHSQDITLKEQYLLTKFLKNLSIDNKVNVELITCTQKAWEQKFI
jgi:hypothetical protein